MKYYKKISIYFLLIVLNTMFNTNFAFASCSIDNTPEYISKYIKNLRKVVSNTNKASIEKSKQEKESIFGKQNTNSYNKVYWALNSLFSWKWYSLNFEYSIWENTKEIPKEVKRDIKMLEEEKDKLNKYYQSFAKKSLSQIEINKDEVCKWIENQDEICKKHIKNKQKSINVLLKASRWINNLILHIKNNAINKSINWESSYFLLTKWDIELIKNDYSKKNLESCNRKGGENWDKGFFRTIIDSIKKISLLWKESEKNTKNWEEAIDLLWWDKQDSDYREKERSLLQKELAKQGIWWDSSSTIMGNLEAYNENWELLWAKQWFLDSIQEQINEFEKTLEEQREAIAKKWWIKAAEFEKKVWVVKSAQQIKIDINSNYIKLKELSLKDDKANDTLTNRMIKMHLNLSEGINTLTKTCKISVKVCQSQKKGQWDCGKCY